LFWFGGFGDQVTGGLLVGEVQLLHGAEETGVSFVVEADVCLSGDVVVGFVTDFGVAVQASAGFEGAQVRQAFGQGQWSFFMLPLDDDTAHTSVWGVLFLNGYGYSIFFIGGFAENGADGLGKTHAVGIAVVCDRSRGFYVETKADLPGIGTVVVNGFCGPEIGVVFSAGDAEVSFTVVFCGFGAALCAAVGAGAMGLWFGFESVGEFLAQAALILLLAGTRLAPGDQIIAIAVVASGEFSARQSFWFRRRSWNKGAVTRRAAIDLFSAEETAANCPFSATDAGWGGGEVKAGIP
jgi:hypothetical protein